MSEDNVIPMFGERKKPETKEEKDAYDVFMEAMRKNKENKEKLAQEREKHNRTIVRNQQLHVRKQKPRK